MPISGGAPSAGNVQGALHVSGYLDGKRKKRKLRKEQSRTLYVNRPVTNAADIIKWAKGQGFATVQPEDMHVTIAFSRSPVSWSAVGYQRNPVVVDGGSRSVERLGDGDCIVLCFDSGALHDRWSAIVAAGASWDWPSYRPHITLSWDAVDLDLTQVEPYTGLIEFGPEEFSELKEDWKDSIVEKTNMFVRDNLPIKITQAAAKYQNTPNGRQRCGRCAYYKGALVDNCDIVAGTVVEDGWCNSFTWRQSQRSDKDIVNPSAASWRTALSETMNKAGERPARWSEPVDQLNLNKAGARHSKADVAMVQGIHDQSVKLGATCDGHNAFNEMRDDKTEKRAVEINARICKLDESLGLVIGWAMISKINGEPYFDLNIDPDGTRSPEHILESGLLKASTDFMASATRPGNEMHQGPDMGTYVCAMPWTTEIAKAFGYDNPPVTGMMVIYKPTPEVFAKFVSGEYKGFSIEGRRVAFEEAA